jgi:biopolymer transport protein ExbD
MQHGSQTRKTSYRPRFGQTQNHITQPEINMTPLIDVMLVLLVIFILASPVISRVLWTGLAQELPKASPQQTQSGPSQQISLQVDVAGHVWINQISHANQSSEENSALLAKLSELRQQQPRASLVLYASKETRYAELAKVLEQAKTAGFDHVAIATTPKK